MNKKQIETLSNEEAKNILDELYQRACAKDSDGGVHVYEITPDGLGDKVAEL